MARKPNKNPSAPIVVTVPLLPHEIKWLKRNVPPKRADGKPPVLGGYQRLENWVIDNYDPATGSITFDPVRFERLWAYISPKYGGGGPNTRLRSCFIPALRRIGRDPLPDWTA